MARSGGSQWARSWLHVGVQWLQPLEATRHNRKGRQPRRWPAAGWWAHSGGGGEPEVASAFQLSGPRGAPIVGPGRVHSRIRTSPSFPWVRAQSGRKGSRMCWRPYLGLELLGPSCITPFLGQRTGKHCLHRKPEKSSHGSSGATPSPIHWLHFSTQTYLQGSSTRPRGPGGQGFKHHVLHEDLVHLCVLHQHHLHHV